MRKEKSRNKFKALSLLDNHLGMFVDRLKLEGEVKLPPAVSQLNLAGLSGEELLSLRDIVAKSLPTNTPAAGES